MLGKNGFKEKQFSFDSLLREVAQEIAVSTIKGTPFEKEEDVSFEKIYQTANHCYIARINSLEKRSRWFVKVSYRENGIPNLMQELFIYDRFKSLSLQERDSFLREAEGPLLLKVDGVYQAAIYLNFEKLPSLQTLIEARHFIRIDKLVKTMRKILEVFAVLERAGIFVWDIKGENILVDPVTHQVLAIDFGHSFVKGANWLPPLEPYRLSNHFYASPEEVRAIHLGESLDYSPSIEVWKLGVLFHEMLSQGQHPLHSHIRRPSVLKPHMMPEGQSPVWNQNSVDAILTSERMESEYLNSRPIHSPLLKQVIPIILKMLSQNSAQRYPNIQSVLDDFYQVTGSKPVQHPRLFSMQVGETDSSL